MLPQDQRTDRHDVAILGSAWQRYTTLAEASFQRDTFIGMTISHRWVFLLFCFGVTACGSSNPTQENCEAGTRTCGADGLYQCQADGAKIKIESCSDCAVAPTPQCPQTDICAGVSGLVCDGNGIRDCAAKNTTPCELGRCVMSGTGAVCAADAGQPCIGRAGNGTAVQIACAAGGELATDQVCDNRTGTCVASTFDCASLSSLQNGMVACDAASGNFLTKCVDGQPDAIVCQGETACLNNGTLSCYTSRNPGEPCGGQAMCYPGMHCVQSSATQSACVVPAASLGCSATDRLVVCGSPTNTYACVDGNVYRWDSLATWGGSCANGKAKIPLGGNCIPGLADCVTGLACDKTPYDVAGICRAPQPGAAADCVLTGQAVISNSTCEFEWASCEDGHQYQVSCRGQRIGNTVITTCRCLLDGQETGNFAGSEACAAANTEQLDTVTNAKCGWAVSTVEVAP